MGIERYGNCAEEGRVAELVICQAKTLLALTGARGSAYILRYRTTSVSGRCTVARAAARVAMDTTIVEDVKVSTGHWIGGERVASGDTFEDVSPIDETTIATVARGSANEVDAAVAAARDAFPGWAALSPKDRAAVLHAVGEGIEKRALELAAVETRDNGSLLRSMQRPVMPRAGHNFHFFSEELLALAHEDFDTRGHTNHVSWDPAGVAAVITPWNAPLMLGTWRLAPALAAGNTVVFKPP